MPDTTSTQGASAVPTGAVDLQTILTAELAGDLRADGRAHSLYLQVMDRAYLDEYLQTQDTVPGRTADLNTVSHVPLPQPYVVNSSPQVPKA
jgi:hypothetical protein